MKNPLIYNLILCLYLGFSTSCGAKNSDSNASNDTTVVSEGSVRDLGPVVKLSAEALPGVHLAPQGNNTYDADNMLDGDKNTAWAVNIKQVSPNGSVRFPDNLIEFTLQADDLEYIMLTNGYSKNPSAFSNNSRLSHIAISRVPYSTASKSDIIYEGPVKDTSSPQKLSVSRDYDNSKPTNTIFITIPGKDYVKGNKFADIVVSEIEFYGHGKKTQATQPSIGVMTFYSKEEGGILFKKPSDIKSSLKKLGFSQHGTKQTRELICVNGYDDELYDLVYFTYKKDDVTVELCTLKDFDKIYKVVIDYSNEKGVDQFVKGAIRNGFRKNEYGGYSSPTDLLKNLFLFGTMTLKGKRIELEQGEMLG